jgi:hypothetical protein
MHLKRHLVGLMAGLLVAGTASAEEIRGVISKVDPVNKELLVEGKGKGARGQTFRFALTADTRILFGSEAGAVADLLVDKRVHVTYDEQDGKRAALVIHANYPKPEGKVAVGTDGGLAGKVQLINRSDREIVIVGSGDKETTLTLPETVKIDREGKSIGLEDLKEGERVAVDADKKDGKWVVRALHVGGSTAPASVPGKDEKAERREKAMKILEMVLQRLERMREEKQP